MTQDTLIILTIIVGGFSIPIFWFFFDYKAQQRRAQVLEKALEVGKSPEEVMKALRQPKEANKSSRMPYRKGFVLIAVGAAMVYSSYIGLGQGEDGLPIWGLILLFLGVAFLLSDFVNRAYFHRE